MQDSEFYHSLFSLGMHIHIGEHFGKLYVF